jgi:hypothetical protein
MVALLCFWLTLLTSPFKSRSRLEAENAALRRQVTVLRRKVQCRIPTGVGNLTILRAITIIRPATIANECGQSPFGAAPRIHGELIGKVGGRLVEEINDVAD